jgi:phosphonate transport system substrate-binding protein
MAVVSICLVLASWAYAANPVVTAAPANRPLKFGVLPMYSPVTLFERFAPVRDYLSKQLQRDILLETAPSYEEFKRRTNANLYDIVLTAPHYASAAELTGHYRLCAVPTNHLAAYLVVGTNSTITHTAQLRGKTIATPSPDAFISIIGKQFLRKQGLDKPAVTYLDFKSHNAAFQSVLGNESQAALISSNIYNQAVAEGKPLRVIAKTRDYPGIVYLTSTNLPEAMANDIQDTFINMSNNTQGAIILQKLIHPGYMQPPPGILDELRTLAN